MESNRSNSMYDNQVVDAVEGIMSFLSNSSQSSREEQEMQRLLNMLSGDPDPRTSTPVRGISDRTLETTTTTTTSTTTSTTTMTFASAMSTMNCSLSGSGWPASLPSPSFYVLPKDVAMPTIEGFPTSCGTVMEENSSLHQQEQVVHIDTNTEGGTARRSPGTALVTRLI